VRRPLDQHHTKYAASKANSMQNSAARSGSPGMTISLPRVGVTSGSSAKLAANTTAVSSSDS